MKLTVCESNDPPIKALIQQHYVPWYCDVDASTEWHTYAYGLGGFTLPLIAVIDPGDSNSYLNRTTGVQPPLTFYHRLNAYHGDIDHSGSTTLYDAIVALQIVAGMTPATPIYLDADINGDNKIDVIEALYILRETAR